MKRKLLLLGFAPLNFINRVLPKKKKRIFFYSNLRFRDNTREFYEYLIENGYHKQYEIILSLNDYKEYKGKVPDEVKVVGNKIGIFYFLRTTYGFYSFGKYPIKPAPSQKIVNLWHGMPLKRIGNLEEGCEKIDYNYFTYLLATSEFFADIMRGAFSCEKEQIMIAGQPRCDALFQTNSSLVSIKKGAEKLITWLPTFRDMGDDFEGKGMFLEFLQNGKMEELNSTLRELNSYLFIKVHPLQVLTKDFEREYSNIAIKEEKEVKDISLYELLSVSDALITDYSSVYFDYLLLDRPIGFTLDDEQKYKKTRGYMVEHPEDYMPGQKLYTFEDMRQFVCNVAAGEDVFKEERHRINRIANHYRNGHFCEQIAEKLEMKC